MTSHRRPPGPRPRRRIRWSIEHEPRPEDQLVKELPRELKLAEARWAAAMAQAGVEKRTAGPGPLDSLPKRVAPPTSITIKSNAGGWN